MDRQPGRKLRAGADYAVRGKVKSQYATCPVSRASSADRCNTVESVDPTALPDGELLCPAVPDKTLARIELRLKGRGRLLAVPSL